MTKKSKMILPGMTRRQIVKAGLAASVVAAAPGYMRTAGAATPIKIGIPTVITGGYAVLGSHVMRTAKLVKKDERRLRRCARPSNRVPVQGHPGQAG